MGHNTIDSGMNSVLAPVVAIVPNSPNDVLTREAGRKTTMVLALNSGAAGAKRYKSFVVSGCVEITRLYGVFTNIDETTSVATCFWQMYRSPSTEGPALTLAAGPDCSGMTALNSVLVKTTTVDGAAEFFNSAEPDINEVASTKQLQGVLINAKDGTATWICFCVTEDVNTDAEFTQYCEWIPLTPGSSVTPGDGTNIVVA